MSDFPTAYDPIDSYTSDGTLTIQGIDWGATVSMTATPPATADELADYWRRNSGDHARLKTDYLEGRQSLAEVLREAFKAGVERAREAS